MTLLRSIISFFVSKIKASQIKAYYTIKDSFHQGSAAAHKPQIKTRFCAKKRNSEKMDCVCRNMFRHIAEFKTYNEDLTGAYTRLPSPGFHLSGIF